VRSVNLQLRDRSCNRTIPTISNSPKSARDYQPQLRRARLLKSYKSIGIYVCTIVRPVYGFDRVRRGTCVR